MTAWTEGLYKTQPCAVVLPNSCGRDLDTFLAQAEMAHK